jgi:glycosyltransferase involved in cell wall biosynthesis
MSGSKSSVLFIVPYPLGMAPSQRFRVEQYFPVLDEKNVKYKVASFISLKTWGILYKGGSVLQKAWGIAMGYLRRTKHVLCDAPRYNTIFIHREAAPLGPPIFEWILVKVLRKQVIYDFDDAIWIPNTSGENKLISYFKAFWKVPKICKWVNVVTAGNHYLAAFATDSGAKNVVYLPTVVDTEGRYNLQKQHIVDKKLVVGWTGSHSTLKFLDTIVPVIQKLQGKYNFTFLVIADKKPELNIKDFTFITWNELSEIEDLIQIDIGLMPLTNDKWSEGKCGFKLIQYMALGIPSVASPVGVNKAIIDENENGYLCSDPWDWENKIIQLLTNTPLREQMGKQGMQKIQELFSIASQKEKFLNLLG